MSIVQMLPVNKIRVINPRARNKVKFAEISKHITEAGLRKPITVCVRPGSGGEFDLVCGQGRLEAYLQAGETHIPAIIQQATSEERYLKSLVENICRGRHDSMALVHGIGFLEKRGYGPAVIASKLHVSETYVRGVSRLVAQGEGLLLAAVERGDLPLGVAVEIAAAKDDDVKRSLAEAFERGELTGRAISKARVLIERRRTYGKQQRGGRSNQPRKRLSPEELVKTYKRATQKQASLAKKARICESMLRIVCSALKELRGDEHFLTLLRAERLDKMPKYLSEQITEKTRT